MKKVLITGVSKGIGRGIAEKFLKEGYTVYGTFNSSKHKAYELVEIYGENRVKLFGPYDFSNLSQTKLLLNELKKYMYDSIICNAGMFSENDDFNHFDIVDFNKVMNCNFYTPMMLCIELKENINSHGNIVLMASNDAYPGAYSSLSYSISKSSIISLMKCLSVNFGSKLIRVNSISPGAIDTDMNTPEQMNIAPYFTPISRVGKPSDIANVVYFLSSKDSGFINGENITIDGGYNIVSILLKSEADKNLSKNLQEFIEATDI